MRTDRAQLVHEFESAVSPQALLRRDEKNEGDADETRVLDGRFGPLQSGERLHRVTGHPDEDLTQHNGNADDHDSDEHPSAPPAATGWAVPRDRGACMCVSDRQQPPPSRTRESALRSSGGGGGRSRRCADVERQGRTGGGRGVGVAIRRIVPGMALTAQQLPGFIRFLRVAMKRQKITAKTNQTTRPRGRPRFRPVAHDAPAVGRFFYEKAPAGATPIKPRTKE